MRDALATQPGFAQAVVDPAPPLVMAPLAQPGLDPATAVGLDLILEGFLLHHGRPRHLDLAGDARVLAGDFCYASGLTRVASAGDLRVIELLAELVALSSALATTGDRDALVPLWRAVAEAIADPSPERDAQLRRALGALRTSGDTAPLRDHVADLSDSPDLVEALRA